jgi:hypothetical protein
MAYPNAAILVAAEPRRLGYIARSFRPGLQNLFHYTGLPAD